MRYVYCAMWLLVLCAPCAMAKKEKGVTTLKDVQPAGTTDKKNKNQQFDFSFDASGMSYVCRTSHDTKLKATDFVVGTNLTYEMDEHKGKLKSAAGKQVKCTVVRVEKLPATSPAPTVMNQQELSTSVVMRSLYFCLPGESQNSRKVFVSGKETRVAAGKPATIAIKVMTGIRSLVPS